jgi:glucosamine-6-phosphate deaminase
MDVNIHDTPSELGVALADKIANQMLSAQIEGRPYLLGCPGGRSPKPVYAALALKANEVGLDFSNVVLVMMDDYLIGSTSPFHYVDLHVHYSCRRFATIEIAAVLNTKRPLAKQIHPENIWFPHPDNCEAYDVKIAAAGGIDMFILASGSSDGHIAFNPPGTRRDSRSRVVRLAKLTRRDNLKTFPDFASLTDVPEYGVTVGVGTIAKYSKSVAMVLFGKDKSRAFEKINKATSYMPDWPATIVTECANPLLYADVAAFEGSRE